jgi:AraC family transcriptional regulator
MTSRAHLIASGALGGAPRSVSVDGFVLTTTTLSARTVLPLHAHERANLNLVLGGAYTERVGRRSWSVPPGSCVVKPAGAEHENVVGTEAARCVVIELERAREAEVRARTPLFDDARVLGGSFHALGARIQRELRSPDAMTPLALTSVLLEFVCAAARADADRDLGRRPAWLAHVVELVMAASRGGPVPSMTVLAATAQRHPAYVARVFRAHFRRSIGAFMREQRLVHAMHMVAATHRPLAQVAMELGYADQSHFARDFRRHCGQTPTEYRRSAQRAAAG